LQLGVAIVTSLPVMAYNAWLFVREPVYAAWAAQNLILSPHPLHYLAAYGVLLASASLGLRGRPAPGLPAAAGSGRLCLLRLLLPVVWVASMPVLVYLPFNLQRRLAEGVQVPLSLLAALGLLSGRLRGLGLRLAAGAVMVTLSLTNALLLVGNSLALRGQPAPIYRDADEVAALDWLAGRVAPDDVVLAAYSTGNYLPARVGARVFVGHGPETVHSAEKQQLSARFFAPGTDNAWRCQLLAEYGVDYVFWGPAERSWGRAELSRAAYLRQVYAGAAGAYVIFEVR
jgi:hypothetical protein